MIKKLIKNHEQIFRQFLPQNKMNKTLQYYQFFQLLLNKNQINFSVNQIIKGSSKIKSLKSQMNNLKRTYHKYQKNIPDEILFIQSSFTQFIKSINSKKLSCHKTQQAYPDLRQSQQKVPIRYSKILNSDNKYSSNQKLLNNVQQQDRPLNKNITNKIKFHDNLKLNFSFHKHNQGVNETQVKVNKTKIFSIRQSNNEHATLRYQSNRQKINKNKSYNLGMISKQKQQKINNISQNLIIHDESLSDTKMKTTKQSRFNISRVSNINFNPEINNLSLMNSKEMKNIGSQNLLLALLKIDIQKAIQILLSTTQQMQEQITGKKIFTFFNKIFKELNIPNIQNPLVKKFNNCVYYGLKAGLNSKHCGIINYNNGSLYLGQLNNFRKHGQGIEIVQCKNIKSSQYFFENTELQSFVIYKGNFYKNTKSGNFLIQAENFMYQGKLVKGYLHGKGKLITKDSIFQGLWQMNQKIIGIEQLKKFNSVYQGSYQSGNFHGKGKLKTLNQLYDGEFEQGKKHGKGIIATKQYIYQGYFKNDKKFGQGIMIDKKTIIKPLQSFQNQNQKIFSVIFQDDYLIYKSLIIKNKFNQIDLQSLKTFNQNNQNLTDIGSLSDKQFLSPTKALNQAFKDNLQITQMVIQNPETEIKQSKLVYFNVIPKQPQQQNLIFSNKKVSYLQGNRRNSFLIRNHPIRN